MAKGIMAIVEEPNSTAVPSGLAHLAAVFAALAEPLQDHCVQFASSAKQLKTFSSRMHELAAPLL